MFVGAFDEYHGTIHAAQADLKAALGAGGVGEGNAIGRHVAIEGDGGHHGLFHRKGR